MSKIVDGQAVELMYVRVIAEAAGSLHDCLVIFYEGQSMECVDTTSMQPCFGSAGYAFDRAPGFEPGGRRFESFRARH